MLLLFQSFKMEEDEIKKTWSALLSTIEKGIYNFNV